MSVQKNGTILVSLSITLLCGVFTVTCAAQQKSSEATGEASSLQFQQRYPRYLLQPGDTFDILFEFSPEFNQTVTVQPDGFITLRGAASLHIADETLPQAVETLRKAYSNTLRDPNITVLLKDFVKPYFTVSGEVGKPGKYDLHGDTTVAEAVAIAGGFKSSAKTSQVLLFRRVSDEWMQARIIDVKKMFSRGSLQEDLHLRPGDMLVVPKSSFAKIEPFIPRASMGVYAQQF